MTKYYIVKIKDYMGYTRQLGGHMTKEEANEVLEFRRKYSTSDCWIEPVEQEDKGE